MRFQWDPRKAKLNLRKHRVSFEEATTAFAIRFRLLAPIPIIPQAKPIRNLRSIVERQAVDGFAH